MEDIDKALNDLIQLAKPPTTVAPPEGILQDCVDLHLRVWKRDVLAHLKPAAPETWKSIFRAPKDTHISYREFAQEVRAYNAWLWDSVDKDRAQHHDIYVALVGFTGLPQQANQR